MQIKGYELEFIDEIHQYLVDGIMLPSITQLLKYKFKDKYKGVSGTTLQKAANAGTYMHEVIEKYCLTGEETDIPELRNFKFLMKSHRIDVLENEVPIILFFNEKPIACGRLDLVLQHNEKIGLGDLKRTSVLDKEYLACQLNLYRLGYQQCYDTKIDFLKGIHLREDKRKIVDIPINEQLTYELINEYLEREK